MLSISIVLSLISGIVINDLYSISSSYINCLYTSSEIMQRSCFIAISLIISTSLAVKTIPVGLLGFENIIAFVRGVISFSISSFSGK